MRIKSFLLAVTATAALCSGVASASTELITNGNFESGDQGQINWGGHQLVGWTTSGYNFLFNSANVDNGGAAGMYGNLQLWGPNNGAANGLQASPVGGNFVASDGAFGVAPLSQTVNGLTAGQQYNVSFYWAGAQQSGFSGGTTEQWHVSLGNQTQSTAVKSNASHGFTGWQKETFTFTATSASEVLSFLAAGTPNGVPPFSLIDGVSMTSAVPEPEVLGMMGLGLGLVGFAARRRKAKAA